VDPQREFVKRSLDSEDERIEVGVAIVGGGPGGLACANRLLQLLTDDPELTERFGEVPVAVIEKGKVCGAHNLSGAMMRPSGLRDLFPDLDPKDWPTYGQVEKDSVYWMLSPSVALPLKPTPPPFRNHGNYMVSVSELSRWMAEKAGRSPTRWSSPKGDFPTGAGATIATRTRRCSPATPRTATPSLTASTPSKALIGVHLG
jgi:electron-transferring-flavoprotein dehydrogenase